MASDASDAFRKQALETEFGQRVNVTREDETSEDTRHAADLLLQAGALLNPKPDTLEYLGAAAIHIYQSPLLGQLFFVSQYPLGGTAEPLIDKALAALRSDVMAACGRKRRTKRSGW